MLKEIETKMGKSLEVLRNQYLQIRVGFDAGLVESVKVECKGSLTPLGQLAQIAMPDPGKIVIKPYDMDMTREIGRAIIRANIGMGFSKENNSIILNIPRMTMERRDYMVDRIKRLGEDAKTAIRNVRRDVKKSMDKSGISEDEAKRNETRLQKVTDSYIAKVQKMVESKCRAVLE